MQYLTCRTNLLKIWSSCGTNIELVELASG